MNDKKMKKMADRLRTTIIVIIGILIISNFISFPAFVATRILYTCALPFITVVVVCDWFIEDYKRMIFHFIWLVFCLWNALKF